MDSDPCYSYNLSLIHHFAKATNRSEVIQRQRQLLDDKIKELKRQRCSTAVDIDCLVLKQSSEEYNFLS